MQERLPCTHKGTVVTGSLRQTWKCVGNSDIAQLLAQKRPSSTPPSVEGQMAQGPRQAYPMPAAGAAPLDHSVHAIALRAPSPSPEKALHEDQIAGSALGACRNHMACLEPRLYTVVMPTKCCKHEGFSRAA